MIQLLKNTVLILPEQENISEVFEVKSKKKQNTGLVAKLGEGEFECKVGERVIFNPNWASEIAFEDTKYIIINKDHIYGSIQT